MINKVLVAVAKSHTCHTKRLDTTTCCLRHPSSAEWHWWWVTTQDGIADNWLTYRVVTRVCHMRGPNVHVTFCCHMHSNWFEFMWHVMVSNCIKTYMSHEVTSRLVWQDLYNKNVKVWSSGVMYQSVPILPIPPGTCGAFDNLAVPRVGYFPAKVRTCRFCWQENEPQ